MPNIVTYESKSGITPSDKGINAAQDAARLYGQVGDEIGRSIGGGLRKIGDAVERHMAVMETSELYKTGTELEQNLQKRYEEESALPENRGDPTFGDRFMAEVAPLLDQWGEGAGTEHGKQLATTLKASIRNKIFNHVAAGQAEMDAAHVEDNADQTMSMLGSGLITDPSENNLNKTLGTAKDAIQGMTATIPDVGMRERLALELNHRYLSQLVGARYQGVAVSIKNQVAQTGDESAAPALDQLDKDIANQLGFQYLSPEVQARLPALRDQAVAQGKELFNSRNATAKSQLVEEGNAAYAQLQNTMTNLALAGQGPTPELITQKDEFAKHYGGVLPGELSSLNNFILQGQQRAQSDTVQPYNQTVRDNIQAGFSLPPGDPRRPTLASLTNAYSHGQITKEDFSGYTEILNKLDSPDKDPAFKEAWGNFTRWQNITVNRIGGPNANAAGTAAARAQFIHDSTVAFMAGGHASGNWDQTLNRLTDVKAPGSFATDAIIGMYNKASIYPNAAARMRDQFPRWNTDGTLTWPAGRGGGRPPAGPAASAGPPPAPKIDQKAVDGLIWGKQ